MNHEVLLLTSKTCLLHLVKNKYVNKTCHQVTCHQVWFHEISYLCIPKLKYLGRETNSSDSAELSQSTYCCLVSQHLVTAFVDGLIGILLKRQQIKNNNFLIMAVSFLDGNLHQAKINPKYLHGNVCTHA